jgi:hypothetical protein
LSIKISFKNKKIKINNQWHKVATGLPQVRQGLSISRHIGLILNETAAQNGCPSHIFCTLPRQELGL